MALSPAAVPRILPTGSAFAVPTAADSDGLPPAVPKIIKAAQAAALAATGSSGSGDASSSGDQQQTPTPGPQVDPWIQKRKYWQFALANATKEQGSIVKSSEVCIFGFNCRRPDCVFAHPESREIGESAEVGVCKFGTVCIRPNCFYKHPDGRPLARDNFVIYMDELEMPKRPGVSPSTEEREVFVDPFPCSPDSPEFESFPASLGGEAETVFQIPGQERGYILFKHHKTAKACVKAGAGTWSEAERNTTSRRWSQKRGKSGKALSAYPICLTTLIRGEAGDYKLDAIRQKAGAEGRLRFDTRDGGIAFFEGQATAAQREEIKKLLTEHLANAHDKISEHLTEVWIKQGLPTDFDQEQAKTLFEGYGECSSITFAKRRGKQAGVRAIYVRWQDAAKARQELNNSTLFDAPITCQLSAPREKQEEYDDDGEPTGYEAQESISCGRGRCTFSTKLVDISSPYCPGCSCKWNKGILLEARRRQAGKEGFHREEADDETRKTEEKCNGWEGRKRKSSWGKPEDNEKKRKEGRWNKKNKWKQGGEWNDNQQWDDAEENDAWTPPSSVPEPPGPPSTHPWPGHVPHPPGYPPHPPGNFPQPSNVFSPPGAFWPPPLRHTPWLCTVCGIENDPADNTCGGKNAYVGCKRPRPW